jgi:CDP-glucose 4,6-dehydratase
VDERVRPLESVAVTDFWRDRPVLVTGATGFLGGWLVRELVARRAAVVCLVRDWVGQCELLRPGASQQVTLVRGDVRSQASIERVLGDYEIDTVFHLAAQAVVGVASRNPPSTLDTNIRGTWSVLEACRRSPQVRQIVVASSDKAYGAHDTLPYHEQTALQGRYPYDVSKSCADLIAQSYAATYALPVIISRCANLYGGSDLNWNRLVPGTIRSVLRGERPIVRSDGQRLRDYLYIEDAVSAYVVLAEALGRAASGLEWPSTSAIGTRSRSSPSSNASWRRVAVPILSPIFAGTRRTKFPTSTSIRRRPPRCWAGKPSIPTRRV